MNAIFNVTRMEILPLVLKAAALVLLGLVLAYGPHALRYRWINPLSPDDRLLAGLWADREEVEVAWADGASPNAAEAESRYSALMIASCKGDVAFVRELIRRGASVHARDRHGATALAHAAYWGHAAAMRELISAGAAVDDRDHTGLTPLAYAAMNGQADTSELLLRYGAGVDAADEDGTTPLMLAAAANRPSAHLIMLLIEAGADPARTDHEGRTARHYALGDNY
jgi:ankyrin repeat protein